MTTRPEAPDTTPDSGTLPPLPRDSQAIALDLRRYLEHHLGRHAGCDPHYLYAALAFTVRDRLMPDWAASSARALQGRRAHYLSLEYLIGRSLGNHLLNQNLTADVRTALGEIAVSLETLEEAEPDAGLGNGGLGRLAACFLDSCATLELPVTGYGLRYEYGMFIQKIQEFRQHEDPDHWLRDGHPWEIERLEFAQTVPFGGHTVHDRDADGRLQVRWIDTETIIAVPFDVPVSGYDTRIVNTLRLWKAEASDAFDLGDFNAGAYAEAVAAKNSAENITMVLYPNDATENGKELRLRQQYLLCCASIGDVLRTLDTSGTPIERFADDNVFQLNDTHPAVAVAELMRRLLDTYRLDWDRAWSITTASMAYTNHTLLPEALERWPVSLFARLLPRHLEIIHEINARFLEHVRVRWPDDPERLTRMSLIEEDGEPQIRMAFLAIVGSFSVNGVAALHSRLLRDGLFRDFAELWPDKFHNKTNGVTPRRWVAEANPELARLLDETAGAGWAAHLDRLETLIPFADAPPPGFLNRWRAIRRANKQRLVELVHHDTGVHFDLDALFDVQVKRIHEYKRQLLNALHVVHLYARIRRGETLETPRMVLIGGKAAPGYQRAKDIIALIHHIAHVVNHDPATAGQLRLVFLPNYNVSKMLRICAGADLSEQISTAGKEASGTGNMKFMMNGAVTIGTLDGANIEIRDAVGEENFFLFGLTAEGVESARRNYDPQRILAADPDLAEALRLIEADVFSGRTPGQFQAIVDSVTSPDDPWMIAADFADYVRAQRDVAEAWNDTDRWTRMSIRNTATSGVFSSDRTIAEYNRDIWKLQPLSDRQTGEPPAAASHHKAS